MIYKLKENRVFRSYKGGKRIDLFCGKDSAEDSFFPEDWTASEVCAFNPGREDIVEGFGITESGELVKDISSKGARCLVKLLDSAERLVIQVHPTREFAKEFFNSKYGKTECWYFLDCEKDAHVYIGFKENVTREEWQDVFYKQDIEKMLSMLHKIPVKQGDCIFVSGGVPHAIGAGCFMIEIQEPSDLMGITERVTPSGRVLAEQKLHCGLGFEKMFDMFEYVGMNEKQVIDNFKILPKTTSNGVYEVVGNNITDRFSLFELSNGAEFLPDYEDGIIIVKSGCGLINNIEVKKGDRLFFNTKDKIKLKGSNDFVAVICF